MKSLLRLTVILLALVLRGPAHALVTATNLTSGASATFGTTCTTASITPSANKLILVSFATSGNQGNATSVSGNGLTWVSVNTTAFDGTGKRMAVWRAMGASPSTGAITITLASSIFTCVWSVDQFDGIDTGGTNGSAAVVQSVPATSPSATTGSATLAAFGHADNATFGAFGIQTIAQAITQGSGFTELAEQSQTGNDIRIQTEWKNSNDTSVDATTASVVNWGVVAVEIKAAAVVGPAPSAQVIVVE